MNPRCPPALPADATTPMSEQVVGKSYKNKCTELYWNVLPVCPCRFWEMYNINNICLHGVVNKDYYIDYCCKMQLHYPIIDQNWGINKQLMLILVCFLKKKNFVLKRETTHANLHRSSSEAGVDVLLEVWIFGGQVTKIWRFVFVSIPRMHRFIESHGEHWCASERHTNSEFGASCRKQMNKGSF